MRAIVTQDLPERTRYPPIPTTLSQSVQIVTKHNHSISIELANMHICLYVWALCLESQLLYTYEELEGHVHCTLYTR